MSAVARLLADRVLLQMLREARERKAAHVEEDVTRPPGTCPNCHSPNNDGSDDVCVMPCLPKREG
jgi:hypothetical protein